MVYTIGYTNYSVDELINILKKYKINRLIDVRSKPFSSYHREYNKPMLKSILDQHNIEYINYEGFGAFQEDRKYYTKGLLDFNKYIKSESFLSGVKAVKIGLENKDKFMLMCAEKDPITCHRSIMISRGMKRAGIDVVHVLDGELESHRCLEERMVLEYFPKTQQLSLFENKELAYNEKLKISYREKNLEIVRANNSLNY